MMRLFCLALVAAIMLQSQVVRADLVINTVSSAANYNVGDTGSVSVFVHSTNAPNDALDSFLFDLNISGGSGVTFSIPQSESFLTNNNYVFFQRSANIALSLPATSVSNAGATLTMADVSYDLTPGPTLGNLLPRTILDANSPFLLGTFTFTANAVGNYSIGLDPSSSFSDVNFNTFNYSANPANFSVSAVPEPSSFLMASLTAAGCLLARRRRKKMRGAEGSFKVSVESADEARIV